MDHDGFSSVDAKDVVFLFCAEEGVDVVFRHDDGALRNVSAPFFYHTNLNVGVGVGIRRFRTVDCELAIGGEVA